MSEQQYNKELCINTKCIIKAIYKDKEYISAELNLVDNSEEVKIVKILSEKGTNDLHQLKFPLANDEFIIFSRKQLDETLFTIKLYDEIIKYKKPKKESL